MSEEHRFPLRNFFVRVPSLQATSLEQQFEFLVRKGVCVSDRRIIKSLIYVRGLVEAAQQ